MQPIAGMNASRIWGGRLRAVGSGGKPEIVGVKCRSVQRWRQLGGLTIRNGNFILMNGPLVTLRTSVKISFVKWLHCCLCTCHRHPTRQTHFSSETASKKRGRDSTDIRYLSSNSEHLCVIFPPVGKSQQTAHYSFIVRRIFVIIHRLPSTNCSDLRWRINKPGICRRVKLHNFVCHVSLFAIWHRRRNR